MMVDYKSKIKNIVNLYVISIVYIISIICISIYLYHFTPDMINDANIKIFLVCNIVLTGIVCVYNIAYKKGKWKHFSVLLLLGMTVCNAFFFVELLINLNLAFGEYMGGIRFILNILIYLIMYLFLYVILNSVKIAVITGNLVLYIIAVFNYEVYCFRGRQIFVADLFSIRTALNVANSYELVISDVLVFVSLLVLFVSFYEIYIIRIFEIRYKIGIKIRIAITTVLIALVIGMIYSPIIEKIGVSANYWTHSENGYAISLLMDIKQLHVDEPEGYNVKEINKHLPYSSDFLKKTDNYPNVVAIMSESYTDYSFLGNCKISVPATPYIDSIDNNIIKGNLYVSVRGGGTANSEWEFLTGNSTIIYPYGNIPYLNILKNGSDIYSMVEIFNSMGYKTIAMHPYTASSWNRENIYKAMGFDEIVFLEDYKHTDELRGYLTDEANYMEIIDKLEQNSEEPLFIFNVTIQNHGGYAAIPQEMEDNLDIELYDDYPNAELYYNLLKKTDNANKMLMEYLIQYDKNTLMLFFGDHQPAVEDEYVMSIINSNNKSYEKDDIAKMYISSYFIWANYNIDEYEGNELSVNYLQPLLFDVAGLPKTGYMKYLSELYKKYPVISAVSVYDDKGNYYNVLDGECEELEEIREYKQFIYNNAIDKKNSIAYFYELDSE